MPWAKAGCGGRGRPADAMVIVNDGSVRPCCTNGNELADKLHEHLSFRCRKNNSEERIANSLSERETVNDIAAI